MISVNKEGPLDPAYDSRPQIKQQKKLGDVTRLSGEVTIPGENSRFDYAIAESGSEREAAYSGRRKISYFPDTRGRGISSCRLFLWQLTAMRRIFFWWSNEGCGILTKSGRHTPGIWPQTAAVPCSIPIYDYCAVWRKIPWRSVIQSHRVQDYQKRKWYATNIARRPFTVIFDKNKGSCHGEE